MTRQLVFQGTQSTLALGCHLTAIGVTLLLILWLLRYERRLVSATIGNSLLLLRLAVLAVILMTLLQPVLSWTQDQKQTGRILIGIDLSDSMAASDQYAMRSEKLHWARGLGLIGNATNKLRLDRWQKALDEEHEPDWVDPDEAADETRHNALMESRRSQLMTTFKELDKISRKEMARRLLTTVPKPLLEVLKPLAKIELFAFAGKSETIERDQLDATIETPSASLMTGVTDISKALQAAGTASNDKILGLILLTDGRDQSAKDLVPLAASLKASECPIYPVLLGSTFRPKDLSIGQLDHPQTVYKGDHPQLKATLNTVGFEGKTLTVELLRTDDPNATPIKRTFVVSGPGASLEFDLDAEDVGRKAYLIRTPVLEGETRDDNNSRSFAFSVVDDRSRVYIVEGDARWEFRYLDAALSRDERIDLRKVLFQQPYIGALAEPFFPRRVDLPADVADQAKSPFLNMDLVILGDVPPQFLTTDFQRVLHDFVTDGGTLVISSGKRWMPLGYQSPILDQLLPLTNIHTVNLSTRLGEAPPSERGLPIQLTVDGDQQSMLQFAADPFENHNIWRQLPGQVSALLGDPKPSATVWATTVLPPDQVDPLAADRKHALIIHQHLGSGQVLWLGFDGTWRWRQRVGDQYHHRFWGQLARWAAANKVTAGNEFVRFGPDHPDIVLGQDAILRAKWVASFLKKYPKLKAQAHFFRVNDPPEKLFSSIDLTPTAGNPLQHEGKAVSLPPGEYRVALIAENGDFGPKPVEAKLYVQDLPSQELSELSANRALLTQIADVSGGRLFLADELEDLPKQFKSFDVKQSIYEESPLWDRWPWLVLLFGLLTTEWVIRKLNGLP